MQDHKESLGHRDRVDQLEQVYRGHKELQVHKDHRE